MELKIIFALLCLVYFIGNLASQCVPPKSEKCEDAYFFCSLSEVNGYCCSNVDYPNPTGCSPLCPSGGAPHNTGWWAFVTQGGSFNISISFSNCSVNGTGVQMGIWGDCNCSESIACGSACNGPGSYTLSGFLKACKTYYLFVDGCSGDVCDFCLTTSEGPPPTLPPLGQITGPKKVCARSTNIKYSVDFKANCEPVFEWFLDENEVGFGPDEVFLDFPGSGEFILCVIAYIGNPKSGSICDAQIVCTTIRVNDPTGVPLNAFETICWETAGNYRLRQNCFRSTNGQVICRGLDSNGCPVDTIINFIVLDEPEAPEVCYLLTDPQDAYVDSLTGRRYTGCQYNTRVDLPRSTDPYRCDSSYRLNVFLPEYTGSIRNFRVFGKNFLELVVRDVSNTCGNSGIMQEFNYSWYLKSDPLKRTLGRSEILQVNGRDSFCVDMLVKVGFCNLSRNYSYTFCGSNTKGPKVNRDLPFPDTTRYGFRDGTEESGRHQHLLSIVTENKEEFLIEPMPNPSNTENRIVLRATLPIEEIILVDMTGRIVWTQRSNYTESLQMELELKLAPGIYQLIGYSSGHKSLSRIVVCP